MEHVGNILLMKSLEFVSNVTTHFVVLSKAFSLLRQVK
jgi:hypothetical protein